MSIVRSLNVVSQELLTVSMPEMATFLTAIRCTPCVTGSPTQTPASAVPFEAPGVLSLTPSTEMSLIVSIAGTALPYGTAVLSLARRPPSVNAVNVRRSATSPAGLTAFRPYATAPFPQMLTSLLWKVMDGSVTSNASPRRTIPPDPQLPPTVTPEVKTAPPRFWAYRLLLVSVNPPAVPYVPFARTITGAPAASAAESAA